MNRRLLPLVALAIVSVAGSAASSVPCKGDYQIGERREAELLSVTIDGAVQGDLSAYEGYAVSVQAEVQRRPVDGIAHYVRFKAAREAMEAGGMRQQRYEWHEFYPTNHTADP